MPKLDKYISENEGARCLENFWFRRLREIFAPKKLQKEELDWRERH